MKTKTWLIIAACLVLIGCVIFGGVMQMLKWDFTKLSTVKYETNRYELQEEYKNISIVTVTANVEFVPSENQTTSVVCYEQKNLKHTVTVKDGTLVIEINDTRKWYEHIGIHFGTPKITVYIPQREWSVLLVKADTGDISVENIAAQTLDLRVSTGRITVSDVTCQGDVNIRVSTGKTVLTDLQCKNLISTGNTGSMVLKQVVAAEKFSIKRSTGDIKLEGCDAAELFMETNTGDVEGSLLTDKVFIAHTDTGKVDVPKTVTGGRCEIKTDTGDIKITIS